MRDAFSDDDLDRAWVAFMAKTKVWTVVTCVWIALIVGTAILWR